MPAEGDAILAIIFVIIVGAGVYYYSVHSSGGVSSGSISAEIVDARFVGSCSYGGSCTLEVEIENTGSDEHLFVLMAESDDFLWAGAPIDEEIPVWQGHLAPGEVATATITLTPTDCGGSMGVRVRLYLPTMSAGSPDFVYLDGEYASTSVRC